MYVCVHLYNLYSASIDFHLYGTYLHQVMIYMHQHYGIYSVGVIITCQISSSLKYSQKTSHSSPSWASYGMSFVSPKYELYPIVITAVLHSIWCYIGRCCNSTSGCFNIKMQSCQYRNSHYKDKMVSRPSCLYNENHHTRKDCLYIETGIWLHIDKKKVFWHWGLACMFCFCSATSMTTEYESIYCRSSWTYTGWR